ncbi:BTB/POZ domain-containing protein [Symbiodinium microadriaticum]|uniref:BTB/POZ domain-containing protein n=1 Tax=Symbiodinium microadriaticum TaxID=2951 RepID=A0A1Q9BX08_SYMMI|nr:BTB/POZ domain-containing protein [Symbiodinium microadriaticum]
MLAPSAAYPVEGDRASSFPLPGTDSPRFGALKRASAFSRWPPQHRSAFLLSSTTPEDWKNVRAVPPLFACCWQDCAIQEMAAMATASEVSTVEGFITKCDIEGLQQLVSEKYNWNQDLVHNKIVPLAHAIGCGTYVEELRPKYLVMIEWMLRSGADPLKEMSGNCVFEISTSPDTEATKLSVAFAGHSTLSFVLSLSELMREGRGGANWSKEHEYLDDIITMFKKAKSSTPSDSNHVHIHTDVVRLWEIAREMTSTHNVVFQTADGDISAHDHILIAASPVLQAMLESPMREGSSKCIPVKDSSINGISLFLDLLYTSSTCLELDYKTMLVAFDVAHRWQVPHVVAVLADALRQELSVDSFVEIAEAAVLKGTASLQQACATFGAKHDEIQAKKETMPPVVRQLLGLSYASLAEPGTAKRRRF